MTPVVRIAVYQNPDAVAEAAAQLVYEQLARHAGERRFALALSGGSTPRLMYQKLRAKQRIAELLNDRAALFFSDERPVPPESEQSNYHLAAVELFTPLGIRDDIVYRMRGEADDLDAEATRYEGVIRRVNGGVDRPAPVFDVIQLGMGPDGHTASVFPDSVVHEGDNRLVDAPYVPSLGSRRLTFTLWLINQARMVLFMVTGAEKAEAVKKVLSSEAQADILPAGRVDAAETLWMIDTSAAQLLQPDRLRGTLRIC